MSVIDVNCDRPYKVISGSGILSELGAVLSEMFHPAEVMVLTDDVVGRLYLDTVLNSLRACCTDVVVYKVPAGESSKSFEMYMGAIHVLAENGFNRDGMVVAVGGGVVSDLAGFAASTYMRGIRFVTVPTTLLSAVDASVGGKTAIDISEGKNQVGTFWQPSLVYCDVSTFDTLSDDLVHDGLAEVIKYSFIHPYLKLESVQAPYDFERLVDSCVTVKSYFVSEDEFDTGIRSALNFGHTIGHGYEKLSGYSISHGTAVAMGMICELWIGVHLKITPESVLSDAIRWYAQNNMQFPSDFNPELMLEALRHDKKNKTGIGFVMIPEMGRFQLVQLSADDTRMVLFELRKAIPGIQPR